MGLYNHHKTTGGTVETIVPGSDMCGTMVSTNSPNWKVGDKVLSIFNQTHIKGQIKAERMKSGLGLPLTGILTEYRVFPDYGLVRKPEYLSDKEAATLPIAGLTAIGTAWGKGEKILIQGTGRGLLMGCRLRRRVVLKVCSVDLLRFCRRIG